MPIEPKLLARAKDAALQLTAKIRGAYTAGRLQTWGDLETYGIPLPSLTDAGRNKKIDPVKGEFFIYVEPLLDKYVRTTEQRLLTSLESPTARRKLTLAPPESCRRIGKYTLYREQEPVVAAIIQYLYNESGRLAVIPAGTGAGKTQLACGVIQHILNSNILNTLPIPLPRPILWFTVKNAVHQTKQRIVDCGFGDQLDHTIFVLPYSALTSSFGRQCLLDEYEVTDPYTGEITTQYRYKPMALGYLVTLDECHCLAREDSQRTKAIKALDLAAKDFPILNTKFLALSATIAEKVNDGRVITCLANIKYQGTPIDWDNFNISFAKQLTQDPAQPSKESIKRLFNAWAEIVFEPPYIKWPHKAINLIKFYEFRNDIDRAFVEAAVERYLDRISQLGRDTPSDLALQRIALLQLRKSIEPCRSELMVDDMVADVRAGNTALCGTGFTGTIIRSVFYLQDTYGVPRSQISVIWGGRGDPRPKKILTSQELIELACSADQTPATLRLLQQQLDWQEDRLLFGDISTDAQDARYLRLKSLGLIGVQSQEIRQQEIDKFQSGQARYCFFTMASGGTGLSFEHCDSRQAPRIGRYTPIYNAKEFVQALGRAPRRNSISDTIQYICLLAGTLEETHVAPRLDKKLQSLGAGLSSSTKDDIFNSLLELSASDFRKKVSTIVRSLDQATVDADNDDSQIHIETTDDDDDND